MKKLLIVLVVIIYYPEAGAQFSVRYDPSAQSTTGIQYFKPKGDLFVGDCIPFYHNNSYYLYWLLDSAHHAALNGMGGHQWALSTSTDLVNWKHYPVVIGIDEDWEKSICTGSIVYTNGQFYAFYATRLYTKDSSVNEQLSYAVSKDGIHFKKQKPNPFYTSAPGYNKRNFRDPKVVVDPTGAFHLFVSSSTDSSFSRVNGALVHLTSKDLKKWDVAAPLLINQEDVPECPDYFYWKGWYYVLFSKASETYYLKSRSPYGPWEYPSSQVFKEEWVNVVKTAGFTNGRRIAAGWVPSRKESRDGGHELFGGNIVLREVIQNQDGDLFTMFPQEAVPPFSSPVQLKPVTDSLTRKLSDAEFEIRSYGGMGSFYLQDIPLNARITFEVEQVGEVEEYGLYVRASEKINKGYNIAFSPNEKKAKLHNTEIRAVSDLGNTTSFEVIMKDDIIDVSIGNRRCIANRLPDQKGNQLWFYAKHGKIVVKSVKVMPLAEIRTLPRKSS